MRECESALQECPAYSSCREGFKAKFKELIHVHVGDSFEQHSDLDKTAYVLGVSSGRRILKTRLD